MSCLYCHSDNDKVFDTTDIFGDQYDMLQCNSCNMYQLSPLPSSEALARAYGPDYYGENDSKFHPWIEQFINYYRGRKAQLLTQYLSPNDHILDIGCGNGQFLSYVAQQGKFNIHGVELPGNSAERAKKVEGLNLTIGDFCSVHFQQKFQAISMIHVFEHVLDPKATLDKIDELLDEKGLLYLSIPNIGSRQAKWFKGDWLHLDPPRHISFYEIPDLKKILEARGYELIRQNHFSLEYNPYGYIQSLLNKVSPKRELLYEKLKGNNAYLQGIPAWMIPAQLLTTAFLLPATLLLEVIDYFTHNGGTIELVFKKR